MICFESIFPDGALRAVREGADILVNITNDGWFGDSPGPVQHNAMAIVRAVENGRYLLRSSNTGISMIVDPVGRIVTSLGLFEEGIIAAKVPRVREQTLYTRFGNRPVTIVALVPPFQVLPADNGHRRDPVDLPVVHELPQRR